MRHTDATSDGFALDCCQFRGHYPKLIAQAVKTAGVAKTLKAKPKKDPERHAEPQRVRLHRAISWLHRAELEEEDFDARFIFLWIAFNAAYAKEFGHDENERGRLAHFIEALLGADGGKRLHQLVFGQFSGPIRTLIENKFVFEPFWKALREHDSSGRWEEKFTASKKLALASVMAGNTAIVLSIVLDRLYVLRNQLVHGGATWNSSANRAQVKDGAAIMMAVIPLILDLMLDHPEVDFGDILYPVV
ncbi:MAG: hypothetical protein K8F35_12720 [Dokdonella sp.]|nr:hypothetical protein [Dokdonella sp.]